MNPTFFSGPPPRPVSFYVDLFSKPFVGDSQHGPQRYVTEQGPRGGGASNGTSSFTVPLHHSSTHPHLAMHIPDNSSSPRKRKAPTSPSAKTGVYKRRKPPTKIKPPPILKKKPVQPSKPKTAEKKGSRKRPTFPILV